MYKDIILKQGRYYDRKEQRLVYIRKNATPEMWDECWQLKNANIKKILAKKHKIILKTTSRYLKPQDGVILEGGCGNGSKVNSLAKADYKVVGIDFAPKTVEILNKVVPELDIRFGDVRNLPLKDSSVAGYWSLGVIEHFYDGYHDIAQEMVRVIKPGGYLFLSYPYMCLLRQVKANLGLFPLYCDKEKPKDFYQFALDHRSVVRTFQSKGFQFCSMKKTSGLLGFNEEIPLRPILALRAYNGNSILIKILRYFIDKLFSFFVGHSCIMVFKLSQNAKKKLN